MWLWKAYGMISDFLNIILKYDVCDSVIIISLLSLLDTGSLNVVERSKDMLSVYYITLC